MGVKALQSVLLGGAVVQSVVGVGQRGPARLAGVQGAHGLMSHRTGRGTERTGPEVRGRARGASHLSHAAHATVKNFLKKKKKRKKRRHPRGPRSKNKNPTNKQEEMKNKMMSIKNSENRKRNRTWKIWVWVSILR